MREITDRMVPRTPHQRIHEKPRRITCEKCGRAVTLFAGSGECDCGESYAETQEKARDAGAGD